MQKIKNEENRDVLTLRSAAKKTFDEYKKHHGQDSKLPRISELNAEYVAVLERKKKNYAEYAKSKAEMQEWLTAQKTCRQYWERKKKKGSSMRRKFIKKKIDKSLLTQMLNLNSNRVIMQKKS